MGIPRLCSVLVCLVTAIELACPAQAGENAAINYLLAISEVTFQQLPKDVEQATSDSPDFGFAQPLTDRQLSFLSMRSTLSSLARFDHASIQGECDWGRYTSATWADAEINNKLHSLARVVLLRARSHYESGQWMEGNQDVERVRLLARRMTLQARPYEHQCFMVENMGMATTASYLLQFPDGAVEDLTRRNAGLGRFAPKRQMLVAEAERIRLIAEKLQAGQIPTQQVLLCIDPYLDGVDLIRSLKSASPNELAVQVLELSTYLGDLSELMEGDKHETASSIERLYENHAMGNRVVAGLKEYSMESFLENAQGICRSAMLDAVIDCLRKGSRDFTDIPDPFGKLKLKFQQESVGFTLVSELRYYNEISFRFGLAGERAFRAAPSSAPN